MPGATGMITARHITEWRRSNRPRHNSDYGHFSQSFRHDSVPGQIRTYAVITRPTKKRYLSGWCHSQILRAKPRKQKRKYFSGWLSVVIATTRLDLKNWDAECSWSLISKQDALCRMIVYIELYVRIFALSASYNHRPMSALFQKRGVSMVFANQGVPWQCAQTI